MTDQVAGSNTEEWRAVVGYEGWYEVSNFGRVRRVMPYNCTRAGHILKPKSSRGYLRVNLSRDWQCRTHSVHRLVAEAFLGPRPAEMVVNHGDGLKTNNRLNNLEYTTPSGNARHALALGLTPVGEGCSFSRLTADQVTQIRAEAGVTSQVALADRYGVGQSQISRIVRQVAWKHLN